MKTIGLLGYGKSGAFIVEHLVNNDAFHGRFTVAFIWNRSKIELPESLEDVANLSGLPLVEALEAAMVEESVDLVVELAHPSVVREAAPIVLASSDFLIGSPTAFADHGTELLQLSEKSTGHIYLATGAAWGLRDIQKMNRLGLLRSLKISMSFHIDSLRLEGEAAIRMKSYQQDNYRGEALMSEGPVRQIAREAPNNTNTMIAVAMTQGIRGLDQTHGELYAHKDGHEHRIKIEVEGPKGFKVTTERINPGKKDAVTGSLTFFSFLNSIVEYGMGEDDVIFF